MFIRNCLKPGDFVCAAPVGVEITLQYNASGNLEKVYKGFSADRQDISSEFLTLVLNNNTVPKRVHIIKGTTWVKGVLYTGQKLFNAGNLPKAVEDDLLSLYIENPSQFNYFAGTIESTVLPLRGALAIRQALTLSKFRILPGFHVPANLSEKVFKDLLFNDNFPFIDRIISNYIIFRKEDIMFVSTKLKQFIVNKVVKYVDDRGYIKAKIYNRNDGSFIESHYPDVVKYNVHASSLLITDGDDIIVHSFQTDNKVRQDRKPNYTCTYCGKVFDLPAKGPATCTDAHCSSLLVSPIEQLLDNLGLVVPETSIIAKWIADGSITSVSDVFILPEYAKVEVKTSLSRLLRALIPTSVIYNDDVFTVFEDRCLGSLETFIYYINNTERILEDFGTIHRDLFKLVNWLAVPWNSSNLLTLLNSGQISIVHRERKFEGAPIFRGKTIYITGDFIRGSLTDIASVLESYSASVVLSFSNLVDCVLVGGKQENIDGPSVHAARNLNIPIMQEEEFFLNYGIDEDLKQV